jgi:hypothetical protein
MMRTTKTKSNKVEGTTTYICEAESTPKIRADVYAHTWGFILPCESGVIWEQQTAGVCCNHVEIEGVFIPLQMPYERETKKDLLYLLSKANYRFKATDETWKRIKAVMHFDFEPIKDLERKPWSQEGFMWIKLTKFESGWGHMPWVESLVGKELVLIYPNSD